MRRLLLHSCVAATLLLSPALSHAQQSDAVEFPTAEGTAFSIGDEDFNFEYLMQFAALLVSNPETIDVKEAYPLLAELAVEQQIAANQAIAQGIDQAPDIQQTLRLLTSSILAEAYLNQELSNRLTQERLNAAYDDYLSNFVPGKLATASHILLATAEEAETAIARLNGGENFADLARELSIGPSGPNGGDLGTFGAGQMVAPFEEATFALTPGTFSQAPVETQFGFHVIYLSDLQDTQPDNFAAMESTLRNQLNLEIQNEIREELRTSIDYTIIPFDDLPKADI